MEVAGSTLLESDPLKSDTPYNRVVAESIPGVTGLTLKLEQAQLNKKSVPHTSPEDGVCGTLFIDAAAPRDQLR